MFNNISYLLVFSKLDIWHIVQKSWMQVYMSMNFDNENRSALLWSEAQLVVVVGNQI